MNRNTRTARTREPKRRITPVTPKETSFKSVRPSTRHRLAPRFNSDLFSVEKVILGNLGVQLFPRDTEELRGLQLIP